jgi:hypothetical protein
MGDPDRVRHVLTAAVGGTRRGREIADQLCTSFVELMDIDGAALAIIVSENAMSSSLGVSGPLSHELMELQFMLGEGPCLQSMTSTVPVMAADLHSTETTAWPTFAGAASRLGVGAVFALPVTVAGFPIGALFLHRNRSGRLGGADLAGAFFAADLAALPILDVMGLDLNADDEDVTSSRWAELTALARSEVYQAAGVVIAQLGVTPAEALVRLRGHAFAHGKTTSQAAYDILEHRVRLGDDATGSERPEEDH